jgi:Domain of unknown function (DUF3471)
MGKYKFENPQSLYSCIPSPIVPLTLPLRSYAGTYHHPAYRNLTIYLNLSKPLADSSSTRPFTEAVIHHLRADRSETLLPEQLTFEHVSGEFFVARSKHLEDFGELFDDIYLVEFKIGVDGTVNKVGIGWEDNMGTEKIWLKRVANGSNLV